jgi:hypothetical protein
MAVHSVLNRWSLVGLLALGAAACTPPDEDERSLVTDQEIAEMHQALVPPEVPPTQASTGKSFYVRLTWGLLAGNALAKDWVDWSGSLSTDEGSVQLSHLIYFENEDHPDGSTSPSSIEWTSHTRPHFDGLVARVEVPDDANTLTLSMPHFERSFRASELTGGDDAVFNVDGEGHAVSLSALPASDCPGGFVIGYMRPAKLGWLAFGGRTTDRTGRFNGTLRFRGLDDGTLKGQMVDESGNVVAQVHGTVVQENNGGSFSAELVDAEGHALGSFTGLYTSPSYSNRGSFQGIFEQTCHE